MAMPQLPKLANAVGRDSIVFVINSGSGNDPIWTFNQRVFVTTTSLAILGSFTNQTPDIYRYIPGRYDEVLYTR